MTPFTADISMTEETGPAAEERRRVVRETLERRRSQLIARSKKRDSSPPSSFDTMVDGEGRLLDLDDDTTSKCALANSTGVDLGTSQVVQRGRDEVSDGTGLRMDMSAFQPQPTSPAQWTPTSEAPVSGASPVVGSRPESRLSSHTEGHSPNETHQNLQSPFSELSELGHAYQERPSTPSTASSFSHVYESADASSDGTLSDLGRSDGGVATPASWSEVGSVVSNDDVNFHNL